MDAETTRGLVTRTRKNSRERGVSMAETAMLLFGIFLAAVGGIKPVGPAIDCGFSETVRLLVFMPPAGSCGPGGSSSGTASAGSSGGRSGSGSGAAGSSGSGSSGSSTSGSSTSGTSSSGTSSSGSSGSLGGASGGWDDGAPVDTKGVSFSESMRGASPQQTDLVLAELSNDVYAEKKDRQGAGSFRPVSDADLRAAGIDPKMLVDKKSGFKAGVYTDGTHYAVVFAGTDDAADVATDVMQGLGYNTAQYNEAAALGQKAKAAYGDNVVFAGHSLAGGLASTAAAVTGNSAVTFNAAGVSDGQLKALGIDPAAARAAAANGQVRAYSLQNEALTTTQEGFRLLAPTALGTQIKIADPSPPGFWSRASGFAGLHSLGNHKMGSFLSAMRQHPPVGIDPKNPS